MKWHVVFAGALQRSELVDESDDRSSLVRRFNDAVVANRVGQREIAGMWISDGTTEEGDVVRVWGTVPQDIAARHKHYMIRIASKKGKGAQA